MELKQLIMCAGLFRTSISLLILMALVLLVEDHKITTFSKGVMAKRQYGAVKAQVSGLNNTIQKNRDFHAGFTDILWRLFTEFEVFLDDFVQSLFENTPKISKDTKTLLAKFRIYTLYTLNLLSDKFLDVGGNISKIETLGEEFRNLVESFDNHFEWAINQLNESLINNTVEYDWWTAHIKHNLRSVNDSQLYKEGCRTLDEFIQSCNTELQNCCKIAMKPMKSLCKDASSLLLESIHTIMDGIDRIQTCLEDNKSYDNYLMPCLNLLYEDISNIILRAVQIRQFVDNMLPLRILYARKSFAIVVVGIKRHNSAIEPNIFEPSNT